MKKKKSQSEVSPYVTHFLSRHELASDSMARFGEMAWNAAVIRTREENGMRLVALF